MSTQTSRDSIISASPLRSDKLVDLLYENYWLAMVWARNLKNIGAVVSICGGTLLVIALACLIRSSKGASTRGDEIFIWNTLWGW